MKYDYTVFIGRFQPFHAGHMKVVERALEESENLIMVLGNHDSPRTPRNPFTTDERIKIIRSALNVDQIGRVHFAPVENCLYNDEKWISQIQKAVHSIVFSVKWSSGPTKIALIGHSKDHSSYYLNLFPTWDSINVEQHSYLDASDWRKETFEREDLVGWPQVHESEYMINTDHKWQIQSIIDQPELEKIALETVALKKYKEQYGSGPFLTTDSVVTQSGYVLLIQRKFDQGEGLWAMPGGFLDTKETLLDGALRELDEETSIKVPIKVLRGSIETRKVYDNPHRSERARIVTTAYHFRLKDGPLPKVKAADDAADARWFTISEFLTMRSKMYDDHYDIIRDLIGV